MVVTRFKLSFGKLPSQFDDTGMEQWSDYCAVTDVSSDKPDEIAIVDLALTGLTKANAIKIEEVTEATNQDMKDADVNPNDKRGLPDFGITAIKAMK